MGTVKDRFLVPLPVTPDVKIPLLFPPIEEVVIIILLPFVVLSRRLKA